MVPARAAPHFESNFDWIRGRLTMGQLNRECHQSRFPRELPCLPARDRRPCRSHKLPVLPLVFFFNDTATTEIYTLSLHDALPIDLLVAADERHEADLVIGRVAALR